MENRDRYSVRERELLAAYNLFASTSTVERLHNEHLHRPNPTLPPFNNLHQYGVVMGTGSPRSARWLYEFPEMPVVSQLPSSQIQSELPELRQPYGVTDVEFTYWLSVIANYDEPRNQWQIDNDGEASDSGLSSQKARIAAATALLMHGSTSLPFPGKFTVIGRDYTVGSEHQFADRPGLVMPTWTSMRFKLPSGWVYASTKEKPLEPLDQIAMLYGDGYNNPPLSFYTANSIAILEFGNGDDRFPLVELVRALLNLYEPFPNTLPVTETVETSFMALKPDKKAVEWLYDLVGIYGGRSVESGGDKLYQIPGIADWSRKPFRNHLSLFVPADEQSIQTSFKELCTLVNTNEGKWLEYSDGVQINPHVDNETVGFPSWLFKRNF